MRVVYYQENNIRKIFFSSNCIPNYQHGIMRLRIVGVKGCLTISGDAFILKKVYDNLKVGIQRHVLETLLSKLSDKEILQKLYDGRYIE